jgi:hypothetical protein
METEPAMTETRSIAATRAIGWEKAVYILMRLGIEGEVRGRYSRHLRDHEQAGVEA